MQFPEFQELPRGLRCSGLQGVYQQIREMKHVLQELKMKDSDGL